ncbi:MAG: bifunctional adenosylcobinamide kinase/adenosylcobinamide-phosphate guanylyltransferase [Rhizobiales bacterium]|nr:bifunctional adenosylcobinamide kinase/adenosylcobinamide-phosphate guanylyltransferase [Hyphomicrobiales bacterium]
MAPNTLVIGAQRSGKSRKAEEIVSSAGGELVYLATATAGDAEMAERIATHRARRGGDWRTVEEPLDLPGILDREALPGRAVLVDCLTLWLSNLFGAERDIVHETDRLVAALQRTACPVVLVSNEVGAGIIPMNALARRYADAAGILNQRVAAACDRVILMAAGIALPIKPSPFPEPA